MAAKKTKTTEVKRTPSTTGRHPSTGPVPTYYLNQALERGCDTRRALTGVMELARAGFEEVAVIAARMMGFDSMVDAIEAARANELLDQSNPRTPVTKGSQPR